eukprot:gb/GECG01008933.1/.p1 GENE.gb/GECG01008933.1/~~gb/GECG01008933.1/.p1  ORF type:complete len:157 (+),score=15.85 gb/GECG01008933.1/:1-471(+)
MNNIVVFYLRISSYVIVWGEFRLSKFSLAKQYHTGYFILLERYIVVVFSRIEDIASYKEGILRNTHYPALPVDRSARKGIWGILLFDVYSGLGKASTDLLQNRPRKNELYFFSLLDSTRLGGTNFCMLFRSGHRNSNMSQEQESNEAQDMHQEIST